MKVTKQQLEKILCGGGANTGLRPLDIVKSHLELIESVEKFLPGFRRIAAIPCQNNGIEGVRGDDGCSSCLARQFLVEMGEKNMVAGFDWASPGTFSRTEKFRFPPPPSEGMVMLDTIEEKKFNFKQKHGYNPTVLLISKHAFSKLESYLEARGNFRPVYSGEDKTEIYGMIIEHSRREIALGVEFISFDL